MTSRDRVRAALEFAGPDRAPRDLWTLPYVSLFQQAELDALRAEYPMDVAAVQLSPETDDASTDVVSEGREYTDEWGSVWQVGEPGVIGEVKRPVLAEWQLLTEYQPPWDLIRNRDLSYANRWCEQTDQFVLSAIAARPFERMQFLRGTENLLLDQSSIT
jgi:uroporphyrinogen decarboxylase